MSKFVSRLEEAGLVQRAPVEGDQRRVGLTLTAAGHKVLRSVKSKRTAWLPRGCVDLDPDELEAIDAAIEPLTQPARGGRIVTAAILRAGARTFLSVRKHRNYRLFFTGQVISNIGTWMQRVAQAWLVLSLTHSPFAVGILALCQFMPFTLFSLIAGVVVDRLDAWRTVIGTQITQMFLASTIAVIALTGVARPWHVYVIAALMGLVQVLDAPSRQQLTFRMVGPLELPNAISLNSGVFNGARIFGPAVAGVVIAAAGAGVCFAINAVSYVAVIAGLLMMRPQEFHTYERRERSRTLYIGLKEGLSFARQHEQIRLMLALTFVDQHVLPQLQRPAAGPREADASFGAAGLRAPVRGLRRRRADRSALLGSSESCDDRDLRRRQRRLRALRALDRAAPHPRSDRAAALHRRRVLHDVVVQFELADPARVTRPPAGTADRHLLLRVRGHGDARRNHVRLAHRCRWDGALVRRRRIRRVSRCRCTSGCARRASRWRKNGLSSSSSPRNAARPYKILARPLRVAHSGRQ